MVDVAFAPSADLTGPLGGPIVAVSFHLDGNILDPAVCGGRDFTFVANVFDPAGPAPFAAGPSFPSDYYDGGNAFPNFLVSDCQPDSWLDVASPTGVDFSLPTPAGGLLSASPDGTDFVMFIPAPVATPDSSLYGIVFETQSNADLLPDNTRFQSWPDIVGPALPVADGSDTTDGAEG